MSARSGVTGALCVYVCTISVVAVGFNEGLRHASGAKGAPSVALSSVESRAPEPIATVVNLILDGFDPVADIAASVAYQHPEIVGSSIFRVGFEVAGVVPPVVIAAWILNSRIRELI